MIKKKEILKILIFQKKQFKNLKVKFKFFNEILIIFLTLDRNVDFLFPVQAESYKHIFDQKDCLVQAYTGTGKTLAFSIPIVELLQNDTSVKLIRGRAPRVLALAPTRELSKISYKQSGQGKMRTDGNETYSHSLHNRVRRVQEFLDSDPVNRKLSDPKPTDSTSHSQPVPSESSCASFGISNNQIK
jgi:superfamily II DNA or RNA helicase